LNKGIENLKFKMENWLRDIGREANFPFSIFFVADFAT